MRNFQLIVSLLATPSIFQKCFLEKCYLSYANFNGNSEQAYTLYSADYFGACQKSTVNFLKKIFSDYLLSAVLLKRSILDV